MWSGGWGEPRFEDCVFEDNTAERGGAALLINDPHPNTFLRCVFAGNEASSAGGAIFAFNAQLVAIDCLFIDNRGVNYGGALSLSQIAPSTVTGCTFVGNVSAGGGWLRIRDDSVLTVTRCIVTGTYGPLVSHEGAPQVSLGCSVLSGNEIGGLPALVQDAGGNVSVDPRFCAPSERDFALRADSPCAPGNHPDGHDCGRIGALGIGCGG